MAAATRCCSCLKSATTPSRANASHQRGGFQPIQMNGQEVYKFAVREVPAILARLPNRPEQA